MSSDRESPGTEVRHLHPLSLLFTLGTAAWRLLVPALVFLVFSRGDRIEAFFAILFFPAAVAAVFRFLTFRYRFDAEDLVVRQGLLFRNERHIPYARIQNVDLVQNPFQRALGVAEVRLQTASGEGAEAAFRVLSVAAVEEIRRRAAAGGAAVRAEGTGSGSDEEAESSSVLVRLGPGDLAIHGLIANRGTVLVLAALGLWWQYAAREGSRPGFAPEAVANGLGSLGTTAGWPVALLGIAAALLVLRLLSVLHAWVTLWGFTLEERGDDLRVSYGLLTRVSATIPRHRIQSVSLVEGPVHRALGRVAIRAQTAGGIARDEEDGRARATLPWLVPVARRAEAAALLRRVHPEVELDRLEWRRVHRSAGRRLFFRRLFQPLVAAALFASAFGPWGAVAAIPVLLWNALRSPLEARALGWASAETIVASRSGWWVRATAAARRSKVQVVSYSKSPFDRRHGTATLLVDTAGLGGRRVTVPYVEDAEARALRDSLVASSGGPVP